VSIIVNIVVGRGKCAVNYTTMCRALQGRMVDCSCVFDHGLLIVSYQAGARWLRGKCYYLYRWAVVIGARGVGQRGSERVAVGRKGVVERKAMTCLRIGGHIC
jgi:hypothetical protein